MGGTLSSVSAYEAGYADGYAKKTTGKVTYGLGHKHTGNATSGGGCYTVAKTTTSSHVAYLVGKEYYNSSNNNEGYKYKCDVCNETFIKEYWLGSSVPNAVEHTKQTKTYSIGCGLTEGSWVRDTDNLSTMANNEMLLSATIVY